MSATNLDELQVNVLKIGGATVTPSASVAADQLQTLAANVAISIPTSQRKVAVLTTAGPLTCTLADPVATTDDGKEILIIASTAQAHVVSNAAGSGFNGAGAGADVGTFAAAIANLLRVVAYQGKWYVTQNTGVTLA
jgi:hypothetical protein